MYTKSNCYDEQDLEFAKDQIKAFRVVSLGLRRLLREMLSSHIAVPSEVATCPICGDSVHIDGAYFTEYLEIERVTLDCASKPNSVDEAPWFMEHYVGKAEIWDKSEQKARAWLAGQLDVAIAKGRE